MASQQKKISVIIPAFNEEKLIATCLKALENQTFPREDYEVIVVDNGSSDKTPQIAKKFPIKVLQYTKLQRVAGTRQYGANFASSPILAFMDADSHASPDWLERIYNLMQNQKLVAVCGVGLPSGTNFFMGILFDIYNSCLQICQLFGLVLPWGFNFAIRKSAFNKIGGYNLALASSDDVELGIRISKVFGKNSIRYIQHLKVYTSTRKQQNFFQFLLLIRDSAINFTNLIILRRAKPVLLRTVR